MYSKPFIAVIGGKKERPDLLAEAEEVGKLIGRMSAILICGGLSGVMEAAARGAKKEGGLTVGILPHDHRSEANDYIDVPIATGLGIGRNVIIARSADALIAVGGEYGTLSEIAFALQMGKPVVGLRTWDVKGLVPARNAREAVNRISELLGKSG